MPFFSHGNSNLFLQARQLLVIIHHPPRHTAHAERAVQPMIILAISWNVVYPALSPSPRDLSSFFIKNDRILDSLFPRSVPPRSFMLTPLLSIEDGRVVSWDGLSTFVLIIEEARVEIGRASCRERVSRLV